MIANAVTIDIPVDWNYMHSDKDRSQNRFLGDTRAGLGYRCQSLADIDEKRSELERYVIQLNRVSEIPNSNRSPVSSDFPYRTKGDAEAN